MGVQVKGDTSTGSGGGSPLRFLQMLAALGIDEAAIADYVADLANMVRRDDSLRKWLTAVIILAVKRHPEAAKSIQLVGRLIVWAAGGKCGYAGNVEQTSEKG